MSKTIYPPYACQCCGYTNGDMFSDFYNFKPTIMQSLEYDAYKKMWNVLNEARNEKTDYAATRTKPRKKYTKKSPYWVKRSAQTGGANQ